MKVTKSSQFFTIFKSLKAITKIQEQCTRRFKSLKPFKKELKALANVKSKFQKGYLKNIVPILIVPTNAFV